MAAPPLRKLTLGEVLDVSFGIYRSRFAILFIIAAAMQLLPSALKLMLADAPTMVRLWPLTLLWAVLVMITNSLAVSASTMVVSAAYLGKEITAGEALRRARPLIWPLFLIAMSTAILLFCGLIVFVLPAFYVYTGLVMAPAVASLESPLPVSKALGRSWDLARGQRWKIGVAVMVPFLLLAVPGSALGIIQLIGGAAMRIPTEIAQAVLTVFFVPFMYVVVAVLYYDQRIRKEGFDLEVLANAIPAE